MQIKICHGSDHIISKPVFHKGNPRNDYGYGFYCTESAELAAEWAVSGRSDGFVNTYRIDISDLRILNINKECHLLNWLAVLLVNRTFNLDTPLSREAYHYLVREFSIDLEPYDIVTGYRADDSYFSFAQDFLNNSISYEQLAWAMKLGYLGDQVVIRSRKAYSRLEFLEAVPAGCREWFPKRELRDRTARYTYLHSDRMSYRRGDLYVTEILDKEIKNDDPRL